MQYYNILSLLFISFFLSTSFTMAPQATESQAKVNWYAWNDGFPVAEAKNSIILVDVYTDWCGWCKRMDRDTYQNPEIAEYINKNFVAIKFNPEHKDVKYKIGEHELTGPELLAMLGNNQRFGFPTTFFLYPQERKINVEVGYKTPEAFKDILKSTVQNRNQVSE